MQTSRGEVREVLPVLVEVMIPRGGRLPHLVGGETDRAALRHAITYALHFLTQTELRCIALLKASLGPSTDPQARYKVVTDVTYLEQDNMHVPYSRPQRVKPYVQTSMHINGKDYGSRLIAGRSARDAMRRALAEVIRLPNQDELGNIISVYVEMAPLEGNINADYKVDAFLLYQKEEEKDDPTKAP